MTGHPVQLIGLRFERLLVVGVGFLRERRKHWWCLCDCGRVCTATTSDLTRRTSRRVKSCGCLNRELRAWRNHHHGLAVRGQAHPLYALWAGMHARCEQPKNTGYKYYGARGIKVCARWSSFPLWLKDMGPRPSPKHSIDRIDTYGNYEPGNCRWATAKEQMANRRRPLSRKLDAALAALDRIGEGGEP